MFFPILLKISKLQSSLHPKLLQSLKPETIRRNTSMLKSLTKMIIFIL